MFKRVPPGNCIPKSMEFMWICQPGMASQRLQYNIVYDLLEVSGKEKVDVVGIHVGTNSLLST